MILASLLGLMALVPLAAIDCVFLAETLLGLAKLPCPPMPNGPMPAVAILMPAHNEAATLVAADAMLKRLIAGGARIIVVADNCSDATAEVAARAGCEVIMRDDPQRRGKGYALAAGRDYLSNAPPGVVIILDADCSIGDDDLALLARRSLACDRVVQAAYLFRHDPQAAPNIQISNFAFAVKNLLRQRGGARLGSAAILAGSGMAFPWPLIAKLDLATGNVVEDLAMGVDLVRRQEAPIFTDAATVWSDASTGAGSATQRSRWEAGFIATARQFAWPLIRSGAVQRDFKQFWLGAHLLVPALSIVLLVNVAAFLLCTGLAVATSALLPAVCGGILVLLIAIAVSLAWFVEGRRHMPAWVFLRIPLYLGWKIAIYARILTGRQSVAWLRTERVRKD